MVNQAAVNASYREAASTLAPQAVSEYLSLSPWHLERRDSIKEIWRLTGPDGTLTGRLMLPLATDYSDFSDRFYDALLAIGQVNGWDADQLREQILATRADLFFVRLDQSAADGTIPFTQAEITLAAIHDMIRAAAESTAGINPSRRGHPPAVVTNFLNDDVRLGHTKRGSFIFTVAARINDAIAPNEELPNTGTPEESNSASTPEGPFARRVMENLASSLEFTQFITDQKIHSINDVVDSMATSSYSSVVRSLEDIVSTEGLRSVELSFQWAAAAPPPRVGREPVKLDHSASAALSRIRAALEIINSPAAPDAGVQSLVGPVISLTRETGEDENKEAGEIVILADIGRGRPRNVHIRLSGEDHDWAIRAYRAELPLSVSGDLIFERQRWRLAGKIELDTRFLEKQLNLP